MATTTISFESADRGGGRTQSAPHHEAGLPHTMRAKVPDGLPPVPVVDGRGDEDEEADRLLAADLVLWVVYVLVHVRIP